jgi:transcriptional regulator with XRE-family HTH domain
MMRPVHLRMARAALNWTLRDFEAKTGVNKNTISRYEAGGSILSDTLERIERVLKAEGIVFIDEDEQLGPGVRLSRDARGSIPKSRKMKTKPKLAGKLTS